MNFSSTLFLALLATSNAFTQLTKTTRVSSLSTQLHVVAVKSESTGVISKIKRLVKGKPENDNPFGKVVRDIFPGAIENVDLQLKVVANLEKKGYSAENTLLATSLCCDELARQLEDDFLKVYGPNFNLGGLAGFPFAGSTGFGAMAAHIPDDGNCLIVYGPHVGVTADGVVGKVERSGIALVDNCCGSAIAASNYVLGVIDGSKTMDVNIKSFSDFQQNVVQEFILPHGKRLADAEDRMAELPYALYDSQDLMMRSIVAKGAGGAEKGLTLLGGIQINTGPDTPDYFHPLRFDYMNNKGEIVEDLLPKLTRRSIRQRLFGRKE